MALFGKIIIVNVTANPATGALIVSDERFEHLTAIDKGLISQTTIAWDLQLNGQEGSLNLLSDNDATSGFSWTERVPPDGIFRCLDRPRDTRITISARHRFRRTEGEWLYKLRATIDTRPYETNPKLRFRPHGDPRIKNR